MNKINSTNDSEFVKVNRVAAPEIVLGQVKNLILNQSYLPGDKLPPERALAEMIGVSRPSLREALKTLEAYGIVEIKHGSGVYVREPNLDFATFPITIMLNQENDLVNELVEAREIVEVEIAVLAARKASDSDIGELEKFLNARKELDNTNKLEETFDFEFERLIAKLIGNRVLMSIQEATHTLFSIGLQKVKFKPLPIKMMDKEHWEIFKAIKVRDENAVREAMIYHLKAPLRKILK